MRNCNPLLATFLSWDSLPCELTLNRVGEIQLITAPQFDHNGWVISLGKGEEPAVKAELRQSQGEHLLSGLGMTKEHHEPIGILLALQGLSPVNGCVS